MNIKRVVLHSLKYAVQYLDLSKARDKMNRIRRIGGDTLGSLIRKIFYPVQSYVFGIHSENPHARAVQNPKILKPYILGTNDKAGADIT